MPVRHYTAAELYALRASPLVAKPENLPSIEQWIEYVYLEVDGVREKLRIPHSESAQQQQHQSSTSITAAGATTRDAKENKRRGMPAEPSPMGSFSTGRPTLGRGHSSMRGTSGEFDCDWRRVLDCGDGTNETQQRTSRLDRRRRCSLPAGMFRDSPNFRAKLHRQRIPRVRVVDSSPIVR
jgi:hypothetical protein